MWPLAVLQRSPSYRRSFDLKCVWEDHHVAVKKGDRVIEVTVMTGLTVYTILKQLKIPYAQDHNINPKATRMSLKTKFFRNA